MLDRYRSKFEIEQREEDLAKEYIYTGEAAALDRERVSVPPLSDLDQYELIGDEDEDAEDENELDAVPLELQTSPSRQKRPRRSTSESLCDFELLQMPTEVRRRDAPDGNRGHQDCQMDLRWLHYSY